jgi:hypothetical protein
LEKIRAARYTLWAGGTAYQHAIDTINHNLRSNVPAASVTLIENFRRALDDLFQAGRRRAVRTEERPTGLWSKFSRKPLYETWSDAQSLAERLQLIRAAATLSWQMLTEEADVSPSAVQERLDRMRAGIPNETELRLVVKTPVDVAAS